MEFGFLIYLIAVFFAAGLAKGVLGIGFPAILIGFLTLFLEPREAIALILVAMVVANLRQALRGAPILLVLKQYAVYCAIGMIGIFIVAYLGAAVPIPALLVAAGIAMILFGASSLFLQMPKIKPRYDNAAQAIAGALSALMGGLTGIWGPPAAAYFASKDLSKDALVQALGVVFFLQSVPLLVGFIASGDYQLRDAVLGTAMLIPCMIAVFIGERLRNRLNIKQFTRAFMIMFILLGLNLIRRGLIA